MGVGISRRNFIKSALGTASTLSVPTIISYLGKSTPSSDKEFLEVRDSNFYLGGEEYTIKGANYLTKDYPSRMFHNYHPLQIDKELRIAEDLGINAVRVGLMHPYSIGAERPGEKPPTYAEVEEEYFENFDDFLDIAEKHDIKVLPICLGFVPWEYFEPKNHHLGGKYLENWLPEFVDDERILAWDVKNEPEIHQKHFDDEGDGHKYDVPGFTRKMAEKIRSLDKNHPVTIGLSDTHAEPGKVEANLIEDLSDYISNEDFYSFHFGVPIKFFNPAVSKIKEQADKPIVLQEFGLPTEGVSYGSEERQKWYCKEILERVSQNDLNGAMVWELNDHPEKLNNLDIPWGNAYDNPGFTETFLHNGILRADYSKKPAAHVVEQYYKWIL